MLDHQLEFCQSTRVLHIIYSSSAVIVGPEDVESRCLAFGGRPLKAVKEVTAGRFPHESEGQQCPYLLSGLPNLLLELTTFYLLERTPPLLQW